MLRHAVFINTVYVLLVTATMIARPSEPIEFYRSRVRPLLTDRCYACHTDAKMGGLRLDSRESLIKGGQSGPAIVPGRPDESVLILAVSHKHERLRMPPQGKLTEQEIQNLREWVEAGAHFEGALAVPASRSNDSPWPSERRNFWAFQPPRKPPLPKVKNTAWPRGPIDHFILAQLEDKGLQPAGPADKRALLRRANFDLIGLPPKPQEVSNFLNDNSPDAFAKVVDRLLASPHYGERWARHWLDVARYADEVLGLAAEPLPNAYRYRDWVIQAFNEDMPYDLFVKSQIAGDLLEDSSETRLSPGLGLFGIGPYYKGIEPRKAMADELHDRVDVLSRGFLGLTVACARCHDHKYDPISTQDYYALAGVFLNTKYTEHPLAMPDVVRTYHDAEDKIKKLEENIKNLFEAERSQLIERLSQHTSRYLQAAWEAGLNSVAAVAKQHNLQQEVLERWVRYLRLPSKDHPYFAWWDSLDPKASTPRLLESASKFETFLKELIREQNEIREYNKKVIEQSKKSTDPDDYCNDCNIVTRTLSRDKYMLWNELFGRPRRVNGGDQGGPGALYYADDQIGPFLSDERKAQVATMRAELKAFQDALPKRYPFLHVIRDRENLTDMQLQIRGDPYNLGETIPRRFLSILADPEQAALRTGSGRLQLAEQIATASNPLAARVMVNRVWHHLFGAGIVRSLGNFGLVGDRPSHPELLDYLATRFVETGWSIKRLHREILLSATYALRSNFSNHSFSVDPENRLLWRQTRRRLDVEALRDSILFVAGTLELTVGGAALRWDLQNCRRTVYGEVSRFRPDRFLTLFDFPDPKILAEKRVVTNTPVQGLFFLNSDFMKEQSRALAIRLKQVAGEDHAARIKAAFQLLFGRDPSHEELREVREFLAYSASEASWQGFAQSLLSSNEFRFID